MRRYGGLQIFLRAMTGGGSMVLSSVPEPVGDFLARAGERRVSHISGTPSHWRRALMSGAATRMAPRYVRMSGEIADQAIIDRLRATFPDADVAHAFASTEAGVAFDVGDGLAGFPAGYIGRGGDVEMRVAGGSLRIRSNRNALGYLGDGVAPLLDTDGFVDTGDEVELRDGRYHFVGRRGGVINIGGQKVHPEEIEAVINRHPGVRMSLVKARKSPITGAIVVADVVAAAEPADADALKREILGECRAALARFKVPASIRLVAAIEVAASGKLARGDG
jgi:acyl-CoA synthetase (AMP-forming)/AMP-acid ligase II